MLPLSANGDFKTVENHEIINPFIDMNAKQCDSIVYGEDAINQSIENVICTMPGECLFNLALHSPLYEILFDNYYSGIEEKIFTQIELFTGIRINRTEAYIDYDAANHVLSISFPYTTSNGLISSVFKRVIGR